MVGGLLVGGVCLCLCLWDFLAYCGLFLGMVLPVVLLRLVCMISILYSWTCCGCVLDLCLVLVLCVGYDGVVLVALWVCLCVCRRCRLLF